MLPRSRMVPLLAASTLRGTMLRRLGVPSKRTRHVSSASYEGARNERACRGLTLLTGRVGLGTVAFITVWGSSERRAALAEQEHDREQSQDADDAKGEGLKAHSQYTVAQYQANEVMEDRYLMQELKNGGLLCGVFDGHGGWQVAEYATEHLAKDLDKEMKALGTEDPTPEQVGMALVRTFERIDRSFIYRIFFAFDVGMGYLAKVGACAITLLIQGRQLYVANAGDCRAVLGRRLEDGSVAATALSHDHNARVPREQEALRLAHPDEPDIIKCKNPRACYVKGRLQPTRALGDAYLKYPEFNGRPGRGADRTAGRYIPPPYTPPYIRATPEITHLALDAPEASGAEFVVMASDGLWDILSNEEVVDLVAEAMRDGESDRAGHRLLERALEMKAEELDMSVAELHALPAGRQRRSKHDDISVVVVYLKPTAAQQ